ncbi:MAG: hypothetical protein RR054_05285 [Clostridia bacterium]
MPLTSNLLYLLLLYAVLDKSNKLTVCSGVLIAVGLMVFGACCNPKLSMNCCPNRNEFSTNRNESSTNRCNGRSTIPFIINNGL